jgi:hypothetical protein
VEKTRVIHHPFFGRLMFTKSKSSQSCYWGGVKHTDNQTSPITIRVYADEQGPSIEQIEFFKQTVNSLDLLVRNFSDLVKPHFEIWCNKNYSEDFLNEFECTGMHIPVKGNREDNWEVTFTKISDKNFVFTIFFEKGVAVNTDLDG